MLNFFSCLWNWNLPLPGDDILVAIEEAFGLCDE